MKKLKSKNGFSFVEMLACVITLMLIAAICSTATGISIKKYQESRFESDSQMLQSTLDMLIGDILRYSHTIEPAAGGTVTALTNEYYQMWGGNIGVEGQRFVMKKGSGDTGTLLVGEKVYAETLAVENFSLEYDKDSRTFTGQYDIVGTVRTDLRRTCTFSYRGIALSGSEVAGP